ncbi:hypothetical protein ERJ75_001057400 [Trypanosoma vivax]|uniref:Uncharacterized protein n=1 Tax=Trypanosoma vivax (strain Y486) TaxID=1055687 RepID=G0U0H0_TRYVY|nr:hypothetical protein TRVL_06777 [Trypanosoma vivax]KAH8611049.1 hypothetical protein ERJ75_001057400 [Trypanosoma vivax]CCC49568.1 conserved hypothetical protein [Trypanosoma vivax Y486]
MSGEEDARTGLKQWDFAWEFIASFSAPRTVLVIESLSRGIQRVVRDSLKGDRLMQRYWNAQYHRLVWGEEGLDKAHRTLVFTLARAAAKKEWKRMYQEEYPLWVARTFQGALARNNDTNEAKVRFKVKQLNERLSREELEQRFTSAQVNCGRGASKGVENEDGNESVSGDDEVHQKCGGKTKRHAGSFLERTDYKLDARLAKHKLKHRKGMQGKWKTFGGGEVE